MKTLIKNARIVNEGEVRYGSILINGETIEEIFYADGSSQYSEDTSMPVESIDATGCFVLPGIIDDHVHFREPGLTAKADIDSESAAAAAGGVTSYFDMPNCNPQTISYETLAEKFDIASRKSHVNYSFFFGATNSNIDDFSALDIHAIPGIKLFMGSSTGNMLVDRKDVLESLFCAAAKIGLPVMAHCEDTDIINANMAEMKRLHGDDPDVRYHSRIRSEEACVRSTSFAVELALKHNARLHVAHLSTQKELELIGNVNVDKSFDEKKVTAEVVVGHLLFCDEDHAVLGAQIKVNPAIKSAKEREALRRALSDGSVDVVGTDHAPHLPEQKKGGCCGAASGMPILQFSLVAMLGLVDEGVLDISRLVQLMCHNPAKLFSVSDRGFLRKGYKADLVIVRPDSPWTVTKECILSKCGWSPVEGRTFNWRVERTFCNGHMVYGDGRVDKEYVGEPLLFRSATVDGDFIYKTENKCC